jgi:hypothetical protein
MRSRRATTRPPVWDAIGVEPLSGRTLLDHLNSLLPESGRGPLLHGGAPLPDKDLYPDSDGWIAGAFEGVMSLHGGGHRDRQEPLLAAAAIVHAAQQPLTTTSVHLVAERLTTVGGPTDVDRMLSAVRDGEGVRRERIAELARWLCRFGVTRGQVKGGIALLGLSGGPRDIGLISSLGLLEDLTLYSVVALKNLVPDSLSQIFELAKQVEGWGRIHAVYRLVGTVEPEIRDWLLRGGYDSGVMVEELAFIAATTGGLAAALQGEVDDDLLDHAGILLRALACGGPAEDMSDYASGEFAIGLYLDRIGEAEPSLTLLSSLVPVVLYLENDAQDNPRISADGRAELCARGQRILAGERWRSLVVEAMAGSDGRLVRRAVGLSGYFGIDPLPAVRRRLPEEPLTVHYWWLLTAVANREQMLDLLGLAEELLPLTTFEIGATTASESQSLDHGVPCIEFVVAALRRFPGDGAALVERALQARSPRLRRHAIDALEEWPRDTWMPGAHQLVAELAWSDPDPENRRRLQSLASLDRAAESG